jgi:phage shock protein A
MEDLCRSRQRVEQQLVLLNEAVGKLDNQMQKCLEAGREDLAREASRRKISAQKQLIDLESQREQLLAEHTKLEVAARELGVEA